jgi:hypothetical protein
MILRVLAWRDMLVQPTALFATIILMPMKYTEGLMWFRRDLRAEGHAALSSPNTTQLPWEQGEKASAFFQACRSGGRRRNAG